MRFAGALVVLLHLIQLQAGMDKLRASEWSLQRHSWVFEQQQCSIDNGRNGSADSIRRWKAAVRYGWKLPRGSYLWLGKRNNVITFLIG